MRLSSEKINYFVVGIFNTIAGYLVGISTYFLLQNHSSILLISIISNIFAISISFVSYKIFVFKTKGNWITEYIRCYIAYSAIAVLNISALMISIQKFGWNIWLSQAASMLITVVGSYFFHKKFTFNA